MPTPPTARTRALETLLARLQRAEACLGNYSNWEDRGRAFASPEVIAQMDGERAWGTQERAEVQPGLEALVAATRAEAPAELAAWIAAHDQYLAAYLARLEAEKIDTYFATAARDAWAEVRAGTRAYATDTGGMSLEDPTNADAYRDLFGIDPRTLAAVSAALPTAPRNPDLDAAIAADPDDVEVYRVYADWLEGHGDPRALLIRAQLADPTGREPGAVRKILGDHRAELLGPLAAFEDALQWRYGFVRQATLAGPVAGPQLEQLLAHASGRFVAWLGITADDAAPVIATLAAKAPPTLRHLSLASRRATAELRGLGHVLARLRTVSLEERLALAEPLALPLATDVFLYLHQVSPTTARAIAAAEMPVATELFVRLYEATATTADLAPLFARALPALTTLAIDRAAHIDELCALLVTAPFAPQLTDLTIGGELTAAGMRALVTTERLGALKTLSVESEDLEDDELEDLEPLRARGVELTSSRYDSIAE